MPTSRTTTNGNCAELWRSLKRGDRVRVVRGLFPLERDLLGREFRFRRWSHPHGYAVIGDEHGAWHLHPEALDVLENDPAKDDG